MAEPDEPRTLCELFQRAVSEHGPRTAQRWVGDEDADEEAITSGEAWRSRTYAQLGRAVEEVSLGLQSLDVEPGDRVAIAAHNCPQWAIADFAILHAGAVTATVYPQLPADQMAYILDDAGAEILFVGDQDLYDTAQAAAKDTESLETIVRMDDGTDALHGAAARNVDAVFPMRNLFEEGQTLVGEGGGKQAFAERWQYVGPDDLATLLYTSGTTGRPKGVKLTHRNFVSNVDSMRRSVPYDAGERFLSFLPLSHSYERTVGHFATYGNGLEVWYARDIETVGQDLLACRPHIMIAVPRLWEKMGQKFRAALDDADGLKASVVDWAMGVGEEVLEHHLEHGEDPGGLLGIKHQAAEQLLEKLRARAGLDQLRLANSGAAALDPEIARFFWSLGVRIYEGYGLTESSPVLTANRPGKLKLGTVGPPIPDVDLKIDEEGWDGPEGEGEILAKGPNIMAGYWNREKATEEALDDGWLRTGDVGTIDEDGFLTITDRKKELFKTAYGKYVAPENVTRQVKRADVVDQVLVVGEGEKFVAALLTPDPEGLRGLLDGEVPEDPTREDLVELLDREEVKRAFEQAVEDANDELPRHEQLKTYEVVPDAWEVGNQLTPTLKLKRRVVEEQYADEIAELFPDD
jgi:long-chain acyl-CoA synthetase